MERCTVLENARQTTGRTANATAFPKSLQLSPPLLLLLLLQTLDLSGLLVDTILALVPSIISSVSTMTTIYTLFQRRKLSLSSSIASE